MPFVFDSVIFLIIGMVLGLVLMRTFGKPGNGAPPSVKLVRTARTPDGREDTKLYVNDVAILIASNDGVRLAEYADEVEQLEGVAARMATSMGVTVEFTRVAPKTPGNEGGKGAGIPMRDLPKVETLPPGQEEDLETRRTRLDDRQARG